MNPKLEARYLQLEKTRNHLLDKLEAVDEAILAEAPAPGKWSVNEIVAHLIQVDEVTVSYIQHKLSKADELKKGSFATECYALLLKLALKSGMKFQAPPTVATVPEYGNLQAMRHRWNELRYTLEDLLTDLPPHLLDKCLFRHPRVGMLTMGQTLEFLQDHFDHHLPQIHTLTGKAVSK